MTSRRRHREINTLADRLNRQTSGVQACVWPGCTNALRLRHPKTGRPVDMRVGPLCWDHANDVTAATVEAAQNVEAQLRPGGWQGVALEVQQERIEREAADERRQRDERHRGDEPGWVYYLRVGNRVKVGFSTDVRRRLSEYPPGSDLLAVEPGSRSLEQERHRQFRGSLLDGREWFRPDSVLLDHAAALVDQHGAPTQFAHQYRSQRPPMRLRRQP